LGREGHEFLGSQHAEQAAEGVTEKLTAAKTAVTKGQPQVSPSCDSNSATAAKTAVTKGQPQVSPSCDSNSARALGTVQQSVRQYLIEGPELFAVPVVRSLGVRALAGGEKFTTRRSAPGFPELREQLYKALGPAAVQQCVRQYLIEGP